MNIFEIAIRIVLVLVALYLLNQLYILVIAFRWRSQDKLNRPRIGETRCLTRPISQSSRWKLFLRQQ